MRNYIVQIFTKTALARNLKATTARQSN